MAYNSIVCAPVGVRDRRILEHNEQSIVKLMDPDRISRLLMDKGVIDNNDRKQILLPHGISDRNRVLLGMLMMRGPEAFKNYVNALNDSRTENHARLARILRNDDPIPSALPVEEKLHDSRHKRISDKIDDHELRLKYLEEGLSDSGRSEDDVESIRAELVRRNTELDELRQQLKTRDGQLHEAKEENKALQKRINSLEKKILSLEAYLKEQKGKMDMMHKQQQQDKRNIRILEDKNSKLEARMDSTEKKMDKKLQDQEKRHNKQLEEIKQMIGQGQRETGKHSSENNTSISPKSSNTSSRNITTNNTRNTAAGNQQKVVITPKNRFQGEEGAAQTKSTRPPPQAVKVWKKSTSDPERLPDLKPGQKKK